MMKTYLAALVLLLLPGISAALPLFDVHLHYTAGDAAQISPAEVIAILERNDVERAVIIGRPPKLAQQLYREAPERILPFLGVYREHDDKLRWMHDEALPSRVEKTLKEGHWRGLGELHIFAAERRSPVFRRLVELAVEHHLVLMIHGDPAVIDTLYEWAPGLPVIWAHAGAYPYPPLLLDYLARYPALHIDLSVRNDRIAPGGELDEQWRQLFERHPERILLGVDTFSSNRWKHFDEVVATTRAWLAQLDQALAQKIAHGNARRLFAASDSTAR